MLYTGHSFRRTLATLLVDGGGDLTDLKRHGGWESSTVAKGYINGSLHHKQEIHKRITKPIALKSINGGITDKNNYQIKSSSEPQIINRVHQPKPSIANTSFKNVNLESADENRQPNVDDGFLDNEFRGLTSTQNATCVVHCQKNAIKKKPKNHSPSKTIMGIFFSISKTVTLRLIYTIIITNQGER